MEISANNLTTLFTGFDTIFQKGFEMAPSYYEKICSIVPSSTSQTIYPWLGRTTGFREWVGDRVLQALEAHAYTIVNKTFEDTVGIERERIEDDQYGVYSPVIEQLGWDARTHPDQLIFGMMKAATNGAAVTIGKLTIPVPTCYDGNICTTPRIRRVRLVRPLPQRPPRTRTLIRAAAVNIGIWWMRLGRSSLSFSRSGASIR
jgi:phage major head subunit gpT-like protein